MPAHPMSRLIRFTVADGKTSISTRSAIGGLQSSTRPWIEAVALVACHVGRYLAQLAAHLDGCAVAVVCWRPGRHADAQGPLIALRRVAPCNGPDGAGSSTSRTPNRRLVAGP